MSTLSIRDLKLHGQRVFMRVDFNVPLAAGGQEITSDKRIRASLPSIQYALDHGKDGIRANAVNADRVRTGLLTDDMVADKEPAPRLFLKLADVLADGRLPQPQTLRRLGETTGL